MQQAIWKDQGRKFRCIDPDRSSKPMKAIAEIGVGGRLHMPIAASAASWVVCCGNNPDRDAWKRLVCERINLSCHKDKVHRSSDAYLNDMWRSAVRKYASINPSLPPVPRELLDENKNKF